MSATVSPRSSSSWEDCGVSIVDMTNASSNSVDSNNEARMSSAAAVVNQSDDIFFVEDSSSTISLTPPLRKVSSDVRLPTSTANTENAAINKFNPAKTGRKRRKQPEKWKINIIKKKRNSGEQYVSLKKIMRDKREIKPACKNCRYECTKHFNEDNRKEIFSTYWALADIEKQRQFIANCMQIVEPRHRSVCVGENKRTPRQNNMAYFLQNGDVAIRVCKLFFKNTLDINDRPIRTVMAKLEKPAKANEVLEPDQRGKHGKHKKVDTHIAAGVREFIENIPKIESHYTAANTTKIYIEGGKTISSIYRDYVDLCKEKKQAFATYIYFYTTFTEDFNISFFAPKKDLCAQCEAYTDMTAAEKLSYKAIHENHLQESNFAQEAKRKDIENENAVVAVYNWQAIMQLPKGEASTYYYKSKINVFNFTVYNMKTNNCQCYVWDEANGKRGVNELGTCVLEYIKSLAQNNHDEIIFYSDNCAGQQENKFIIVMYLYAVRYLGIKSITHKFLIKGHNQNEVDSAHTLIERVTKRMLKSGPIYTTESLITIIRSAKKTGQPLLVKEMCYEDFFELKILLNDMGPFNMRQIKLSELKVLKVQRASPNTVFFKTSYAEAQYSEANIISSKKQQNTRIDLTKAYKCKIGIPNNKREDINELIEKNIIPRFYHEFYNAL
ncbi:uncharacterized protein LOC105219498 [Zeugodacus cucurbitae]|uniref:Transmembrane and TPR repeat-containing protein 2 n=1 Tax=Zeugodacus cucurbitae TaxID=28588 RepID=A0A0A1XB56_ZEUCU|nr:uncharacterized protein LOC105219498 [Zeugodacus cucurbitae]XP_054088204.1 uncharacterized protein LOC105219498 [Zeugodacus cucurbitae]